MRRLAVVTVVLSVLAGGMRAASGQDVRVEGPDLILRDTPFGLTLTAPGSPDPVAVEVRLGDGTVVANTVIAAGEPATVNDVVVGSREQLPVEVVVGGTVAASWSQRILPGFVSVLPPLVAILMALVFREVVTSLFAGIWLGCLFLAGFNPVAAAFMAANRFARGELADADHAAIILFTMLLGGMVGVVSRMGGMKAIVDAVAPLAKSRASGQVASWLAGLAVFFDDYSNSLIVGNTMRPLTDRLRVSREKLAYIVDSTAAPVAAVFFISTWIGYEVTLIDGGLELAAVQFADQPAVAEAIRAVSPFGTFLQSIPYLFYPLLAIFTVGVVAVMGRDFGLMLVAERRAASGRGLHREGAQLAADMGSELEEAPSAPRGRWWNGALPVGVLVATTLGGLVATGIDSLGPGEARSLRNIFGGADPYSPLMWGAILSAITAIALATGQKILTLSEGISALLAGFRAMLMAIVILLMAWSLGAVTQAVGTASFLAGVLTDTLPPALLPVSVFLVSSAIAFATGTSWATMAILLPLVVPLAVTMVGGMAFETAADRAIVLGGIGSVLAGAIMGDHCSPISDTTVLSSTASSCDHVDHVRTQLPYALLVGGVAAALGSIPSALGVSPWICLAVGAAFIVAVFRFVGRPVDGAGTAQADAGASPDA